MITKTPWIITEKPFRIVGTPDNEHSIIPVVANLTSLDLDNAKLIVEAVNYYCEKDCYHDTNAKD